MTRRIIISIIWPGDLIFGTNDEKLSAAALKQGVISAVVWQKDVCNKKYFSRFDQIKICKMHFGFWVSVWWYILLYVLTPCSKSTWTYWYTFQIKNGTVWWVIESFVTYVLLSDITLVYLRSMLQNIHSLYIVQPTFIPHSDKTNPVTN